ncbi:hypothetical protein ACTFIZ_008071 [Dictyostelium cf. discoideum]
MSTSNLVPVVYNSLVNLRTSTNYNGVHTQFNSVLNFKNGTPNTQGGSEAWCAAILDTNQYIIAGSENPKTYVSLAIQGRGDMDQWVTSFKVRYTLDGVNWKEYRNGSAIAGNSDRNTVTTHFFDQPIRARSIAICPLTWNTHISLRFELYAEIEQHSFTQVGRNISPGADTVLNSTTNTGAREVLVDVLFPVEFKSIPLIAITLGHIDTTSADATGTDLYQQTRVDVQAINVTTKGFKARFYVWRNARAYNLRADYVATSLE